jgi:hypothetical protein
MLRWQQVGLITGICLLLFILIGSAMLSPE